MFHVQHRLSWRTHGPGVYSPPLQNQGVHSAVTEPDEVALSPHFEYI